MCDRFVHIIECSAVPLTLKQICVHAMLIRSDRLGLIYVTGHWQFLVAKSRVIHAVSVSC